jgi:hypothetical protein
LARAQFYYENLCLEVGRAAQVDSDSKVAKQFKVTPAFVKYWSTKFTDPLFHAGELGGAHNCLFDEEAEIVVQTVLWELVKLDDTLNDTEYAALLTGGGIAVDRR